MLDSFGFCCNVFHVSAGNVRSQELEPRHFNYVKDQINLNANIQINMDNSKKIWIFVDQFVAASGFELELQVPKTWVLPLHHTAVNPSHSQGRARISGKSRLSLRNPREPLFYDRLSRSSRQLVSNLDSTDLPAKINVGRGGRGFLYLTSIADDMAFRAGGGHRTRTSRSAHQLLKLAWLPIPPPRLPWYSRPELNRHVTPCEGLQLIRLRL